MQEIALSVELDKLQAAGRRLLLLMYSIVLIFVFILHITL